MSLDLAWNVTIGGLDTNTDFTNRVTGLSINQQLGFMQPAGHKVVITLNNFDGALTPGAGGTYSTFAWFEQAVFITCTVNSTDTAEVFHGIVDDFDIQDDGVSSTVTLTALDWLSIGARGLYPNDILSSTSYVWTNWANRIIDAFTLKGVPPGETNLPKLDQDIGVYRGYQGDVSYYAASTINTGFKALAGDSLGDVMISRHQAAVPSVIWPTTIDKWSILPTLDAARYDAAIVGDTLTRSDANATTFVFTEGTPAAGELPVNTIDRGYDVDRIINQATVTSAFTTNTVEANASTSTSTTGIKSLFAGESTMLSDTDTQRMADNIVQRFSNVHFQARRISVESSTLAAVNSGSKEELAQLLDVRYGLWQTATVEYTPTGAATPTIDNCVIAGRQIKATPGRTTIALELLPAVDYQSFTLDSDVLGVLDQNRLG